MRDVALTMKKRSVLIMATIAMAAGVPVSMASTMKAPGVAGQSAPIAGIVNTAQIFQHSLNIHYGEPIRAVEQQSVRAFALGTLSQLPVFTRPGGEVIVPLGQVLPVLQTAPGNFSVVILGKGVKPVSLAGAPSAEWVVKETVAGGLAAGRHPILEIMPRFAGLKGSIQIVATSPHGYPLTYTVGLVSGTSRFTPVLSFYRVPHVIPENPELMAPEQGQPAKVSMATSGVPTRPNTPHVNATHADVDWTAQCFTGDCKPIQPISVVSNQKATFIHLPTGKTPMVLVRNKAGKSLLVSYRMEGHTLAVGAVPYRIDLLTGNWNHLAEIRLTNEAGE
ncbi:TrbG/VirB9 family P-type conjugative transfer protein [Acidithiobacillus ferrooxidans]|jgi:type IV secretion system protein VirB9|uniref:Conjugal transfer protein n=1 Tax=Acidithiobacillus ferrooxidans TaxID=920 RepID=A0A2W1K7Z6_ACIFR|nr:TrbG/VirB9 family P-type conjugative transfer protein [Acidithiobacillus ferrooxidans]MBU2774747.1 TrbG/VirB9 family P-type conjugative transfer protein [Acidithiobacillus ferrooxidans]MCR0969981.1 TrbG/VirB9 family P-type conjugative transfer protein [Acidithiobacillus ferrooxidans]MCR1343841.1 TrbG/VirB9 family P-type conjugative transfer protein [Acidithiobacillus ferrooxidans]MCR1350271.1 TrbG/VirB9 family P-type conjugative transfer protein [Acidithiobacillus ferrooxidans]MCR1351428.1 